jgi:DsbC/DsbD-like thiol-disulfide interchange protein
MNVRLTLVALCATATVAQAQMMRPRADTTTLVATDGVHAGSEARIALRVTLPEGLHVQSNKPRDPNLIPTVVTFDPTGGITVAEIVYPKASELAQAGQPQPLAVFEQSFLIGIRVAIDPAAPTGELVVPARFRYQACDAAACYPPATVITRWMLRIVPASTPTPALQADLFEQIRFAPPRRP